jgi:hypothetical protein
MKNEISFPVHKSPAMDPMLSQMDQDHALTQIFPKTSSISFFVFLPKFMKVVPSQRRFC